MEQKTAALIGATGLIGSHLLQLLIRDTDYSSVRVIVRRPLDNNHPKVQVIILDFKNRDAFREALRGSDAVFCAVGTTQQKVKGDRAAYRSVDYDIPVTAAQLCAETGIPQFLLVSTVGADSGSRNFYLKLKGEVEEAVQAAGVPSLSVFRPSMLLGRRKESRPAERIGQVVMTTFSFLVPARYKAVPAEAVARAMIAAARKGKPGFVLHHYREIMQEAAGPHVV